MTLAWVPISLEETLRHFALDLIREPAARADDEPGDVAVSLVLM
jgi:hypothetical protein